MSSSIQFSSFLFLLPLPLYITQERVGEPSFPKCQWFYVKRLRRLTRFDIQWFTQIIPLGHAAWRSTRNPSK